MIFDQFQRYKTVELIINKVKQENNLEQIKILELGANEECNLEKVLPNDIIIYSDLKLSDEMKKNKNFIQVDGTSMPQFNDGEFDVVIALDVLEHVPNGKRKSFLHEATRVARYIALVCFPYDTEYNIIAEKNANDYYKALYGENHIWLQEHIQNGLPEINDLVTYLKDNGIGYESIYHGDISIWQEMIKALFASYKSEQYSAYMESLNETYNKLAYCHDLSDKSYRIFLIMSSRQEQLNAIHNFVADFFDSDIDRRIVDDIYRISGDMKRLGEREIIDKRVTKETSKIYFDLNGEFSENRTKIIDLQSDSVKNFTLETELNADELKYVKIIRLDPIENHGCIIKHLEISQGGELLSAEYVHGVPMGENVLLNEIDPMIYIRLKQDGMPVSIKCEFSTDFESYELGLLANELNLNREYQNSLSLRDNQIVEIQKELKECNNQLLEMQKMLEDSNNQLIELEKKLQDRDNQITEMQKMLDDRDSQITEMQKTLGDRDNQITEMQKVLEEKDNQITEMQDSLIHRDKELLEAKTAVEDAKGKYEHIINTKSWKITAPLRKIYKTREVRTIKNQYNYNIEKFDYSNNVLNINGWGYDADKNCANGIKALFFEDGILVKELDVNQIERKDVKEAFLLNSDRVGFSLQIGVENFKKLQIYMLINDTEKIKVGEIKGKTNNKKTDKKVHFFYLEKGNYINIESVKKTRVKTNKKVYYGINQEIDIIVPIYNGYQFFDTLFTSAERTKQKHRYILINDNSTDERIEKYIEKFCHKHPDTIYIKNESNLGFVQSVNKGLKIAKNHVVLLNTDVEVPKGWLERLMKPILEDNTIATTTPFTTCGTICSFPDFCKDNKIIDGFTVGELDSLFQKMKPKYTEMPTGVGFCMGMNINAIKKIGLLDVDTFGKGYGEENDWCQRAVKAGYRNVQIENLFVYHKHGGSFMSDEKKKLLEVNSKALSIKHPNYLADVAEFCSKDPNKTIRQSVLFDCLKLANAETYIYINHCLGGGATSYQNQREKELLEANKKFIEISYDAYATIYKMRISYKNYSIGVYSDDLNELIHELDSAQINHIYLNEIVSFPKVKEILDKIISLKEEHGAELVMLMHDFYCICPTVNLLNKNNMYCFQNYAECEMCIKDNNNIATHDFSTESEWRNVWRKFLEKCNEVRCFSKNSQNIVESTYPDLTNITLVPHIIDYLPDISGKKKHSNSINIGLLGVLSERKGLSIVREMLDQIEEKNENINIILIGECEEKITSKHFKATGRYQRERLPYLVCENDIDIFFIPSVWPETFSYTTEEIMTMKLPIAVFNIGAPAERVINYDKGIIIDNLSGKDALGEIIKYVSNDISIKIKEVTDRKVLCVAEYISFSSRYRLEHLQEQLFYKGVPSDFYKLDDAENVEINKYTEVVIYRCTEYEKLSKLVEKARQHGCKIYYDIDDYIFDYEKIKNLDFLNDSEYEDYDKYCNRVYKCMSLCDEFITSTNHLQKAISEKFPERKVQVNRNKPSMEMVTLSEKALRNKRNHEGKVVLGYFSGSKTHNSDFELISDAIFDVMKKYDYVYLTIGGCLEVGKKFDIFKGRIKCLEFMDWKKLPEAIARIDINLMPLEDTFFHACKSENKWMEAALVKVPTILSYNDELASVIKNKETGAICKTCDDWKSELEKLIVNQTVRETIATNAYDYVQKNYLLS